jgi:hypothetical protein
MDAAASCPYCGEPLDLVVDAGARRQRYVEDCAVCCKPIEVAAELDDDGEPAVTLRRLDD